MKKYFACLMLAVLGLLSSTLYLNAELTVLDADPSIGRLSPVAGNKIYVRMKAGNLAEKKISSLQSNLPGFESMRPVLPSSSLKSGEKAQKYKLLKSNPNADLTLWQKSHDKLTRTFILEYDGEMIPEKYCRLLMENPAIELAEPVAIPKLQGYTPNDPLIGNQTGLQETQAFEAWEIEIGNSDVIIGISDSGVLQDHEDLENAIYVNDNEIPDNGIDDDENGYIDDYRGYNFNHVNDGQGYGNTYPNSDHGTEAAGIASADSDNGIGITGFGFNTSIFPLLVTELDGGTPYPVFGYESIIYAAENGIDVLNLSWGGPQAFSEIEQSIIDYAVANDVAIVAASGNMNYNDSHISKYYPAGYKGVLGVGQTKDDLIKIGACAIGEQLDIFAPSYHYSTGWGSTSSYTAHLSGTSFATPAVSGAVALVRSKYPELSAMQSLEVVRQCGDEILEENGSFWLYEDLFPKRLNMYKALTTDPMSIPGIRPEEIVFKDSLGNIRSTFGVGEEINIEVVARNYLGSVDSLTFTVSLAFSPNTIDPFEYIEETVGIKTIESGEEFTIGTFKIRPIENEKEKVVMRIDIQGKDDYRDFFKFSMVPVANYTSFENNAIAFSILSDGNFGFYANNNDEPLGNGFTVKGFGNQLYDAQSGLIACENMKDACHAYNYSYAFNVIKKFGEGENRNVGIVEAPIGYSVSDLGMRIKQTVGFPDEDAKSAFIDLEMTALEDLSNPGVGYLLDFDVFGNPYENTTYYFEDAVPENLKSRVSAQVALNTADDGAPWIAAGCIADDVSGVAPAASGLTYSIISDFSSTEIVKSLTSGVTWQNPVEGDISMTIGMAYPGTVVKDEVKRCRICIAGGEDKEEVIAELHKCLGIPVAVNEVTKKEPTIYPNPAQSVFFVRNSGTVSRIEIIDIYGRKVSEVFTGSRVDISGLPPGNYFVKISENNTTVFRKLSIVR